MCNVQFHRSRIDVPCRLCVGMRDSWISNMAPVVGERTSSRQASQYSVARNLQFAALLVWVCSVAHGLSTVGAAAERIAESAPVSRAGDQLQYYDHPSGIPSFGRLGPAQAAVAWELPKGPIRKVLVVFESVHVQPYEFWDRSPSCLRCTGLPEKRKIVIDAIARNYAVLIPHPLDIERVWESLDDKMWDTLVPNSPDILNILFILAEWKSAIGLEHDVPTVALGVSTGGEVVSTLALLPGIFESIAMMISEGIVETFESATHDYPPTMFIHMPKNTDLAETVDYERKLLSSKGVPTKEVRWCEHRVTPDWFAKLIPGVDEAMSKEIYRHLRELRWLDDKTHLVKPDTDFQNEWLENVREWNLLPPELDEEEQLIFADRVWEELTVAHAYHVTLARSNNDLFAWFEGSYLKEQEVVAYAKTLLFKPASY